MSQFIEVNALPRQHGGPLVPMIINSHKIDLAHQAEGGPTVIELQPIGGRQRTIAVMDSMDELRTKMGLAYAHHPVDTKAG